MSERTQKSHKDLKDELNKLSPRERRALEISGDIIELADGEPCGHPGCLHHTTHPCEGCGRIGGRSADSSSNKE